MICGDASLGKRMFSLHFFFFYKDQQPCQSGLEGGYWPCMLTRSTDCVWISEWVSACCHIKWSHAYSSRQLNIKALWWLELEASISFVCPLRQTMICKMGLYKLTWLEEEITFHFAKLNHFIQFSQKSRSHWPCSSFAFFPWISECTAVHRESSTYNSNWTHHLSKAHHYVQPSETSISKWWFVQDFHFQIKNTHKKNENEVNWDTRNICKK